MAIFILIAGRAITGLWFGALINEDNKIEPFTIPDDTLDDPHFIRLPGRGGAQHSQGNSDPLSIKLHQGSLVVAVGISVTSLIGSPMIKDQKKDQPANPAAGARTMELLRLRGRVSRVTVEGRGVAENTDPEPCPVVRDMLKGDEAGNGAQLDLGKVQMLYFTLIILGRLRDRARVNVSGQHQDPPVKIKQIPDSTRA